MRAPLPFALLLPLGLAACDPVAPTAPPPSFTGVAAGDRHSCGLADDGLAYCWGDGASGQLGTGTTRSHAFPAPVEAAGPFTAITAGGAHTCALAADGSAHCWGANDAGQAGVPAAGPLLAPTPVETALRFTDLSAGEAHTCGIAVDGAAYCWGDGADGRLGDGGTQDRSAPSLVAGGDVFRSISAGGRHTCAVTGGGLSYCWGANELGQLGTGAAGDGSATPVPVVLGPGALAITAGARHSCAVTTDRLAVCWGEGSHGKLGHGVWYEPGIPARTEPALVSFDYVYTTISAGDGHTCGTRTNGETMCWGDGASGQLGNTQLREHAIPQLVFPRPGVAFTHNRGPYVDVDAGAAHACGVTGGGELLCWGSGDHGQLGTGHWLSAVPHRVGFVRR